jgi:hypothetical protein
VVLRLDARKYFRAAVGESPFHFLARRIYGLDRDTSAQRQEFERVLREAETVCLVDNLARFPLEDQVHIGRRLQSCSGTVFTASPGISDEDLVNIGGEDIVRAVLAPLDEDQIQRFTSGFAGRCDSDFDLLLAQHIARRELPETAQLPLGLTIICEKGQGGGTFG